jgi:hypothetical protein
LGPAILYASGFKNRHPAEIAMEESRCVLLQIWRGQCWILQCTQEKCVYEGSGENIDIVGSIESSTLSVSGENAADFLSKFWLFRRQASESSRTRSLIPSLTVAFERAKNTWNDLDSRCFSVTNRRIRLRAIEQERSRWLLLLGARGMSLSVRSIRRHGVSLSNDTASISPYWGINICRVRCGLWCEAPCHGEILGDWDGAELISIRFEMSIAKPVRYSWLSDCNRILLFLHILEYSTDSCIQSVAKPASPFAHKIFQPLSEPRYKPGQSLQAYVH